MEEKNKSQEFLTNEETLLSVDIQEKIKKMWRTIEELKQKVTEERELLQKEREENERMVKAQENLMGKLSSFHFPNCPAYTPQCPVHPYRSRQFTVTDQRVSQRDSSIQGDHVINYMKLLGKGLDPIGGNSEEELFRVNYLQNYPQVRNNLFKGTQQFENDLLDDRKYPDQPLTAPSKHAVNDPNNLQSYFTRLLSEKWRLRPTENCDSHQTDNHGDQEHSDRSPLPTEETQQIAQLSDPDLFEGI